MDGLPDSTINNAVSSIKDAENIIGRITADNATLKVKPEELISQAENVTTKVSTAQNAFTEMCDTVKRTASYWMGEAGDKHRTLFEKLTPRMDEIFKDFLQHADNLKQIASTYTTAEAGNVSNAEPLAGDVIV